MINSVNLADYRINFIHLFLHQVLIMTSVICERRWRVILNSRLGAIINILYSCIIISYSCLLPWKRGKKKVRLTFSLSLWHISTLFCRFQDNEHINFGCGYLRFPFSVNDKIKVRTHKKTHAI